jgi:methyl-accepting chemotaxis protein
VGATGRRARGIPGARVGNIFSRAWRALTVPTFKMRIGQTFVVVLCIVTALIVVGVIVMAKSSDARAKAQNSATLAGASDSAARASQAFATAATEESSGNTAHAAAAVQAGRKSLLDAKAAIETVSTPGAAEQISTGSEDQARKVEDTSLAMAEVSRAVEGISEEGQVSARHSELTAELAEGGGEASTEAARVMSEIYSSVKHSEVLVEGLGERFAQIGIIIDVITDIADQTNLLALNAAIEAARAGEHGKGFAVVAGEVRKLAENSKRSAEQISHLIREISSETSRVSASMTDSTGRVDTGREVVHKTGEALDGIVASSHTAARAASEISSTILSIAANTDRVFGAINDIAAIAEETAASTQQVAATINEQRVSTEDVAQESLALASLASKLHELTEGFNV